MQGVGGLRLFFRSWEPEQPRGSVVLVHGTNEHTGRYEHLGAYFAAHGLAVYALDQRGHGRSEGTRCHVAAFQEYLDDLRQFIDQVQGSEPPMMIGHSLGGLIAYRYGLTYPETIRGLVISSPFFGLRMKVNAVQRVLAPVISTLIPRLRLPANISPEHLSTDPAVVKAFKEDPLRGTKVTPRWFMECQRAIAASLQETAHRMRLPVLFLEAGEERIVDPGVTRQLFEQIRHQRKNAIVYLGKYHEIFNDPGFEAVFDDVIDWIETQELLSPSK